MSKHDLLIEKFIGGTLSSDEREVLKEWLLADESNMSHFKNRLKETSREISVDFDAEQAYERFISRIKPSTNRPKTYFTILKYAAIITVLISIGFLTKQRFDEVQINSFNKTVEKQNQSSIENEIVIKFSDGSTRKLSENDQNITADDGVVVASKKGNTLSFEVSAEERDAKTKFHEVLIPNGQTFKLKLSDGTLVWLNAGSKLRFPSHFSKREKERMVYLEGEAFFEVSENKNHPFIVNTQEVDIKVLGTKFNVSSYDTDENIATTLVEGAVSVYETRTPDNEILLSPNFQANYHKFGNSFDKTKVNTDNYTAWMQGRLIIDNLKFSEILQRLERRYAVKFVNNVIGLENEIYKGEFTDEKIESVLKTISLSTPFKFEINQNIITISE